PAPRAFATGSRGSRTPKRAAVPGMSCIRPTAPLGDTASGRPEDSTMATASSRSGSIPYIPPTALNSARWSISSRRSFTPCAHAPLAVAKSKRRATAEAEIPRSERIESDLSRQNADDREAWSGVGDNCGHVLCVLKPGDIDELFRDEHRVSGLQIRIHQTAAHKRKHGKNLRAAHVAIALIGHDRPVRADHEQMVKIAGFRGATRSLQVILDPEVGIVNQRGLVVDLAQDADRRGLARNHYLVVVLQDQVAGRTGQRVERCDIERDPAHRALPLGF